MKGNRYPNVEVFYTEKSEWNHLLLTEPKKKQKWRESFVIFTFIANFTVFKRSIKIQIWWSNPLKKCDFLKGLLPKYFFVKMYSSGGKQTMHKISAASIVKNCHP